jgi:DtxR family Mn-dependent transcriptional regulator
MNQSEIDISRERHEELIETIGVRLEKGITKVQDLQEKDVTILRLEELAKSNHIALDKEGVVSFLPKGEREYLNLIRRHRLAERLMREVLDISDEEGSEEVVCKLEHILTEEVSDSICTLMGHPKTCPHGRPIPPGRCCELKNKFAKPIIAPLILLEEGEEGVIAFISTTDRDIMTRLSGMGIIPGMRVRIQQLRPAVTIQFEQTILSMDSEYAEAIFARRVGH